MNNEPDASLRRERVESAPGGRVLWAPGSEREERGRHIAPIETPHSTEQHEQMNCEWFLRANFRARELVLFLLSPLPALYIIMLW